MRSGWLAILLLVLLACLAVPTPCWASGGEGGGTRNIFEYALDLAIWTTVVFLLLMFVLSKYAWPFIIKGLNQREKEIHAAIEEAKKAREESQRMREHLQQEMDKAQDKMRELMEEARRDAQKLRDELTTQAKAEIQAERDRLRREIDVARDQALHELWGQSAQLATLIASKAIRRQLNPDDQSQLVNEALDELRSAAQERQRSMASVS